ncbi:MAG TPA: aldehyde dehydrogenase [Rhodospirillaceae bacterium]|nr:aldehyde dehydrogenase [Rhodospirillaceae bacterium]
MSEILTCISPVDGSTYAERLAAEDATIRAALDRAAACQAIWRRMPVAERAMVCARMVDAFIADKKAISEELAWQMGRPVRYGAGEIGGFEERARHMISIAEASLADRPAPDKPGFTRFIRRQPLGTVLAVAPWNYPYLTAVNAIVPAIMAGNAVILKHATQTPLCGERLARAFHAAGAPNGLFQVLHLTHEQTAEVVASPEIGFVAFTGSVPGGAAMERAAAGRFIGLGLELGGKDPAYVRADANLPHAIENVTDGAFFNSGQSCCGIERVYVHADVYDDFVAGMVDLAKTYVLGDPLDEATTLGPMVRARAADFVRGQIAEAVAGGATAHLDAAAFDRDAAGSPYMAPQVLTGVDHKMRVMTEESFGPVVGVMKVASDDEAVALMNDSDFGLTASIWTSDEAAALELGDRIETGTLFMNRADYLDPALAWTGVKNSGRGCTLSPLGYDHLTRPRSFHLRTQV